jgi:hypothetical protein
VLLTHRTTCPLFGESLDLTAATLILLAGLQSLVVDSQQQRCVTHIL